MSDPKKWQEWPLYVQKKYALSKLKFKSLDAAKYEISDQADVEAKEVVAWTYDVLSALDSKASALMTLNGVLIAAATFLLGAFSGNDVRLFEVSHLHSSLVVMAALLSALSIGLCLLVVDVRWPFLGEVKKGSDGQFDFSDEIKRLAKESDRRQCIHRGAWWVSLISVVLLLIEFVIQTFHIVCPL